MKSYLRFLSRNKLYTATEVVGLSVSLAFIILMSAYVIGNMSYDREINTFFVNECDFHLEPKK